jgi:hypothetical protein
VCYGVAGLLALKDEQGQPLITYHQITGFCNEEVLLSMEGTYSCLNSGGFKQLFKPSDSIF